MERLPFEVFIGRINIIEAPTRQILFYIIDKRRKSPIVTVIRRSPVRPTWLKN